MPTLRIILLSAALLFTALATAQTTYRWIDNATGKPVFSDQPPPPGTKQVVRKTGNAPGSESPLPYATRLAAEKFPVTLYTAADCVEICQKARDLLNNRGIPFSEKILQSEEDSAKLAKHLGSEAAVPSIIIGQQNFRGFESDAWNNLLDLAGYRKSAHYGAKPSGAFAK